MRLSHLFKASLLSATLAASLPAFAADYYVVVPVPSHTAVSNIGVSLASYSLPAAQVGQAYAGFDFKSLLSVTGDTGFTGYGVRWSVAAGILPAGLTLNADGTLTGTPSAGGSSTFQVMASYKSKAGQQSYSIYTAALTVTLASATPPLGLVGQSYSYDLHGRLTVSGDAAYTGTGVTWSVWGSTLPPGLYLANNGVIVGTPTASGTGSVTARATYKGVSGEQTYQVVTQVISVSLGSMELPAASQGLPYAGYGFRSLLSSNDPSFQAASTSWAVVDALPAGLVLNANGLLTGTPTASGAQKFTLRANYKGYVGQQSYTLNSAASSLITASVPSLNFSSVSDYTTATQTVTLTNAGDAAGTLALASSSSNFTVSGCSTIPAKGSCTATVSFYPTGVTSYAGNLSITGATSGALTVPLTGSAVTNVQTFTASTTWTIPAKLTSVKLLVVGGGGGSEALGGTVSGGLGGIGGGGGQVRYNVSFAVTPNSTVPVTVGAGGDIGPDAGQDGLPSAFGSLQAVGGISGYTTGASGNGFPAGGVMTTTLQGPGGGGATAAGGAPDATFGGKGGAGVCSDITGTSTCYGGGGGGGTYVNKVTQAPGGIGGGGIGGTLSVSGVGGTPNTGGGGGAGGGGGRGGGGTGVVIVAY
jgi:hypothetical protein